MTPSSAQVPYIGSTISLLSKAGIRYEGFLHSIDQSEASVTLDHVRVFGTEDRQCDRHVHVPSSTETFEYIIFRASDITELRVIDTPLSRPVPDPAIIRVQSKSAAAAAADSELAATDKAGGPAAGRRRQAKGPSSSRTRQRYQQQHQPQQHQQQHHHQQLLMHPQPPPPPMMQHQLRSPPPHHQQQTRFRNDWYGGGSGGGGGGYRGGYYPQYRPQHYQAEFAATGFMAPSGMGGGGGGGGGGGAGGGRPVMHFRRYHGNNAIGGGGGPQRYASSAGPAGGGGRGRQSRRPHQSDGIGQAAATPGRYFSADYDFETANAEMAKLLMAASGNGGGERGPPASADAAVIGAGAVDSTASASASASAADDSAGHTGEGSSRGQHVGYDKERSFYDDIGRVDVEERTTEAGGDSARPGGRKEAAKQNALNRETFGLSGRRAIGGRLHGNHHRGVQRRSPV